MQLKEKMKGKVMNKAMKSIKENGGEKDEGKSMRLGVEKMPRELEDEKDEKKCY